jgi:outer membrane receptor protein involved in Fe transport
MNAPAASITVEVTRHTRSERAITRLGTLLLAGVWSLAVWAQTPPPEAPPPVEEIVITGSRIATPNATSTSPIQVVTDKEIQLTGKTDVSDILYQLPQNFNNSIGQDFSSRTSGLSGPGGLTTADLRGLGPNRTLVLVDGRRLGQGDANTLIASPAPDLDQIPAALIERVDVVTGGASAVYGSDAIAGVVNFIMKKNFEGLQTNLQIGENWHENHNKYVQGLVSDFGGTPLTGSSHDGRNRDVNIIAGTNFADGSGNVTAYFGYLESDGVPSSARDFGGCELFANQNAPTGTVVDSTVCGGSSNSNYFRVNPPRAAGIAGTTYSVSGTSFVPRGSIATAPPASFNSQQYIYMARGDQRYTAGFMAHESLNDYVQPYMELMYMNDKTHQQIAPSALFRDNNPYTPDGGYLVNCSNPLLSAQEAAAICTPAQIAADKAVPGSASVDLRIGRRNVEGAGRASDYEHQNYRAVFGAKGKLDGAWNYDLYGQYYYSSLFNANTGFLNFVAIGNALQVTTGPNGPVCISGGSCVPYNIFKDGGVTQDALNYLYLSGTAYGTVTERTAHADMTGELGKYGIKLPTATEGIAVNVGYEHRNDYVSFAPDSGELSGNLAGFGGAAVPIHNGISVDEEFIELRAPLVQEKSGVRDLMFDTGFRRSDYTSAGVTNTHKFELQYAPLRDLRFRGSLQRAIRAPSIIELYNPQLVGQITFGPDPCAPTPGPGNTVVPATASLAQCQVQGVTAAQYGNGGTTNTVPQGTASQLSQLQGGNPKLTPEAGDSYTVGFNFSPTALPSLTGSIDYYRIKLDKEVGPVSAGIIMNNCLATSDPAYCSLLVRSPVTGGLTGATPQSGGYIVQTNVNIGAAKASGIDLQTSYKLALPHWGTLRFTLNGAYLQAATTTPIPGAHTYDCAGLFGISCQTVNPHWRHNLRTSWETPSGVEASLNWRYIGSVGNDQNSSDPTLNNSLGFGTWIYAARIPAYSYLDLALTYQWKGMQIRGGINNLLDKDPPILPSEIIAGGAANTSETYDTLGRQLFVAVAAKF